MSTRVIYYSDRADDPLGMAEVLEAADAFCAKEMIPFSGLVNAALRVYLKRDRLSLEQIRETDKEP